MSGRLLGILLLGFTAVFAAALWYFQIYAFYQTETPEGFEVRLTSLVSGQPEKVPASDITVLDAETSPLKFRACFRLTNSLLMLTETYVLTEEATPLQSPSWFECFDAAQLTEDLETGKALAFVGQAHISYGIDRIVAVYDDGRGFAWHQINECGTAAFDGKELPAGCPDKPES